MKSSVLYFKMLKSYSDSEVLYEAASNKEVCDIVDNFIDGLMEPAKSRIKTSFEQGMLDGFTSLNEWRDEVKSKCPVEYQKALLGEEFGFNHSKMIVTFNREVRSGKMVEDKVVIPTPHNAMFHYKEAHKAVSAKWGHVKHEIIGLKNVSTKDKEKAVDLEL